MAQPSLIAHLDSTNKMEAVLQASEYFKGASQDDSLFRRLLSLPIFRKIRHPDGPSRDYFACIIDNITFLFTFDVTLLGEKVMGAIDHILEHSAAFPAGKVDAYIGLEDKSKDGGGDVPLPFKYYLVNHNDQKLFWLGTPPFHGLRAYPAVFSASLDIVARSYYWKHIDRFPVHIQLDDQLFMSLRHRLCWIVDGLARPNERLPFTYEECVQFLNRYNYAAIDTIFGVQHARRNALIAEVNWKIHVKTFEYKEVESIESRRHLSSEVLPSILSFLKGLSMLVLFFNIPMKYKGISRQDNLYTHRAVLMAPGWKLFCAFTLAWLSALCSVYIWVFSPGSLLSPAKQVALNFFNTSWSLFVISFVVEQLIIGLRGKWEPTETWLALWLSAPEVSFVWGIIMLALAIGCYVGTGLSYLTLVILGASTIVTLIFAIDGRVKLSVTGAPTLPEAEDSGIPADV